MKAWSLAWNCAGATVGDAVVTQVRRTGKGCLSYLVASGGRGAVIDPALPADVYLALADARQVRIGYVLDTHIHADHISRARQLASASGADLLLPAQDRARFPHRALRDGDGIEFGGSRLVALATPGHTMESMSYLVDGAALFTGDTLFPSSVGRPDLLADAASARVRAALLYRSVARLLGLGPDVMLFAGHASAPPAFDGVPIAASLRDVNAQLGAWIESEAAFLERILTRIPATPPNFERIVAFNEAGEFPDGDVTDLEAGANRCAIG
jgi:glyoxylase-like metal-dependent hydrolase (beta-lactamase superfamily II)